MQSELTRLEAAYCALLERLGGSVRDFPFSTEPAHNGAAHFEARTGGGYALIVTERGIVVSNEYFTQMDEVLYAQFRLITGEMASHYAAQNAPDGADFRRSYFARQLELMGRLSSAWRLKLSWEIADILASAPYRDKPALKKDAEQNKWGALTPFRTKLAVGGLLAGGFGLVLAAHLPLVSAKRLQADLTDRGVIAQGEITDTSEATLRFAKTYSVDYRFEAGGTVYEASESIGEQPYQSALMTGHVNLRFDPQDPARSLIVGNDKVSRMLWLYGIVDVLLIMAGLWIWRSSQAAIRAGSSPEQ